MRRQGRVGKKTVVKHEQCVKIETWGVDPVTGEGRIREDRRSVLKKGRVWGQPG